jgi:hypothetical protein
MARYNTISATSSVAGGNTITTPSSGLLTTLTGSGIVIVPNPVLYTGQSQTFYNSTGSAITLSTNNNGNFVAPGFTSAGTISLPAGSIITVVSDGANYQTQGWLGGTVGTPNLVATGGTINAVNIGATTAGTGAFTTLGATSTTTLAGMTATTGAFSGISTFTNSAAVTLGSTSTGALQVTAGGASIYGGLYVGGQSSFGNNTAVTLGTAASGALQVTGGVGIGGSIYSTGEARHDGKITFGAGNAFLNSSAGDNFTLTTKTNTPNPNFNINIGDGAGGYSKNPIFWNGFLAFSGNAKADASPDVKIDASGNVFMYSTGNLQLPKGTTAQRPTAAVGYFRFNTTTNVLEFTNNSSVWVSVGLQDGSSFSSAAPSATYIKSVNATATDGVYWLNFTSGTGQPFQAYIVFSKPDGPWVKAVQYNNGTDLSGSAAVNAGGAWTTSQISLNPGKLASADINILKASLSTMWRVTGGSDNLMNNGTGTLKINWTSLPNWGTDAQPQSGQTYDIYLDNASDGVYEYGYRYVPTVQGRCNHTTSIWISDHSSPPGAGSTTLGSLPPYTNMAICWTVGPAGWYTNMHPWSGLSGSSGGSIGWGNGASTACSIFFKN